MDDKSEAIITFMSESVDEPVDLVLHEDPDAKHSLCVKEIRFRGLSAEPFKFMLRVGFTPEVLYFLCRGRDLRLDYPANAENSKLRQCSFDWVAAMGFAGVFDTLFHHEKIGRLAQVLNREIRVSKLDQWGGLREIFRAVPAKSTIVEIPISQ